MKNLAKLIIISVFGLGALLMFLGSVDVSRSGSVALAEGAAKPTPTPAAPANTAANANVAVNANAVKPVAPTSGDKTIPKTFTLGKDSLSEDGEAMFDHESHAFKNYSPDGKSVMGCTECHHTDQPKSALKPPLLTSQREVALTFDTWKTSTQKVNECRTCHFQDNLVPDGKEMPSATYTDGGASTTKELNNKLAFHINCNTCHDAAFKLRPELKKKPGFATAKDCTICHKIN
jgi:hypothetical protein